MTDQIYVPVRADGVHVLDNGGDSIAVCPTPDMAWLIAESINGAAFGSAAP